MMKIVSVTTVMIKHRPVFLVLHRHPAYLNRMLKVLPNQPGPAIPTGSI
jgi:hypothetical protein